VLFLRSQWAYEDCHLDFMRIPSNPIETAGPDQDAADSREHSRDASAPAARASQSYARRQAAAAAGFERLKARLRHLVGTNNVKG
jgi:hypothetical protein